MRGVTIWLTGLSGSGKTTIAKELTKHITAQVLDGDVLRFGINSGLGFSKEDRGENVRRISCVCKLLNDNGTNCIVSAISPYDVDRYLAQQRIGVDNFILVHVDCPLEVCEERDVKGLYAKARAGELKGFTGIDDPYERPLLPAVQVGTDLEDVETSVACIVDCLRFRKVPLRGKQYACFVGRWSPPHKGHEHIIRQVLAFGEPVWIAVRDTAESEVDPFSVAQRIRMLEAMFEGYDVIVTGIPDICSINVGRKVGYDVNFVEVPEEIGGISATEIRRCIVEGDSSWKDMVSPAVAEILMEDARCQALFC